MRIITAALVVAIISLHQVVPGSFEDDKWRSECHLSQTVTYKNFKGNICSSKWPNIPGRKKTFRAESSVQMHWWDAYQACRTSGGRLARVESEEENHEVLEVIKATGLRKVLFWIGATDAIIENIYIWLSTQEPVGYTYFHPGQPDHFNGESCLTYWEKPEEDGYMWNDAPCRDPHYSICEYFEYVQ